MLVTDYYFHDLISLSENYSPYSASILLSYYPLRGLTFYNCYHKTLRLLPRRYFEQNLIIHSNFFYFNANGTLLNYQYYSYSSLTIITEGPDTEDKGYSKLPNDAWRSLC